VVGAIGCWLFPPWVVLGIAEVGRWSVGYPTWFSGSLAGSQRFDSSLTRVFSLIYGQTKQMTVHRRSSLADGAANDNFDGLHLHALLVLQQFNLLPDWTNLNKNVALL